MKLLKYIGAFVGGSIASWLLFGASHGTDARAVQFKHLLVPADAGQFWILVTALATLGLIWVALRGLASLAVAQQGLKLTQDGLVLTQQDLALTSQHMETQATRDGWMTTVAQCEKFGENIINLNGIILNDLSENKIPLFVQAFSEVQFDPDNAGDLARAHTWWATLPLDLRVKTIEFLNLLEAWCMYPAKGLIDSEMAFGPCGPPLVTMVVQCYAPLLIYRAHSSAGNYPNLIMVYQEWIKKIGAQQSGAEAAALMNRLTELQSRTDIGTSSLPGVIGTKRA